MIIAGLDLGTRCGWSLWAHGRLINSGAWHLKPRTGRSRFEVFERQLEALLRAQRVTVVVYEDVHAHSGMTAAHVFGGWAAVVETVVARLGLELRKVSTGQARVAAGVVFASKAEIADGDARRTENKRRMVAASAAIGWPVTSHDEADAVFIGKAAAGRST